MNTHFILTGGFLGPCERRAILSARIHGGEIILWHVGDKPDMGGLDGVHTARIDVPSWLESKYKCHIYDVLGYQIAYEQGGLILGLDTISIRSAWDLLTTEEVVVSTDWVDNDSEVLTTPEKLAYPYNNNFLAKKGSEIAGLLYEEAKRRIINDPEKWGITGPWMLSDFVRNYPDRIKGCPFPALCGWAPGYIWRFYLGLETSGPNVRVIHLCESSYFSLYESRYSDWALENPYYAGEVARRTDANEHLLRCP